MLNSYHLHITSYYNVFNTLTEIADFMKSSLEENYFSDIAKAFGDLSEKDSAKANDLIETHAYLHPLPFGSCMRNIIANGCPKRMACQSGASCVNFTVTGKMGELGNLQGAKNKLINQLKSFKQDSTIYKQLNEKIGKLEEYEKKIIESQNKKIPITLSPTTDIELKQPKTLVELFAFEHEKLNSESEEKFNG